jgi:mRNA interferase RelE/StbE
MVAFQVALPPDIAEFIAHLPPGVKRVVKAGIRALAENPGIGEPLHGELKGRFKYRVRRYRIVYAVDRSSRIVRLVAVGHRRSVYEELAEKLKEEK